MAEDALARAFESNARALETNNERLRLVEIRLARIEEALTPSEGPSRLEELLERLVAGHADDNAETQGKLDAILAILRAGQTQAH